MKRRLAGACQAKNKEIRPQRKKKETLVTISQNCLRISGMISSTKRKQELKKEVYI